MAAGMQAKRWLKLGSLFLITCMIVAALLWQRVFISIAPGETGVLYRLFLGMEEQRVFRPGLHAIFPWDRMTIYETRKQVAMHEFDILTNRGLVVNVRLAMRYHPQIDQTPMLHQQVGPDYLRRVVLPQVESALRRELGKRTAEDIYTNSDDVLGEALELARDEVGRNFVVADEIVIRSIALPDRVKQAIQDKLVQRERLQAYVFRIETAQREADRLRLEADARSGYHATIASSLTEQILSYQSVQAAEQLATAPGARLVLIGDADGLPFEMPQPEQPVELPPSAPLPPEASGTR